MDPELKADLLSFLPDIRPELHGRAAPGSAEAARLDALDERAAGLQGRLMGA